MAKVLVHGIALVVLLGSGPSWASAERRDGRRGVFSSWVRSLWRGTHRSKPPAKPTLLDHSKLPVRPTLLNHSKSPVKPIHLDPPVELTLLDLRVQDLGRAVAGSGSPENAGSGLKEKHQVALKEACHGLLNTIHAQPGGSAKLDLLQRERITEGTFGALELAIGKRLRVHQVATVLETLMAPMAFSSQDDRQEIERTFTRPLRTLLSAAHNHKPPLKITYLEHLDVALRHLLNLSGEDKP